MRKNPFAAAGMASGGPLQFFTNREQYLEAFARHLQTLNVEDAQLLVFYGVGGAGKTTLIQKLCAGLDTQAPALPYARFNLDNIADQTQAYREVLLRLRADLENNFRLSFPRFDLALAVALARDGGTPPAMLKVSPHLSSVFEAALEFTPSFVKATTRLIESEIKHVIKKSDKLEQWVRRVGGTEGVLSLTAALVQDEQIIQDELIRRFAQDLAALPERGGSATRCVLFLDTYEALWTGRESGQSAQARGLDNWVRCLAEYCLASGVLLVITGRDRLNWDSEPDWDGCLDQHLLGGVSARDAQDFLARRGIGAPPPALLEPLPSAILHCAEAGSGDGVSSSHLLTLALCADIVLNTRLSEGGKDPDPQMFSTIPTAHVAGALATRFLKSLHSRNLELWVEALSLTPRFDETAALALDSSRLFHNGRAGWEQVIQYSFIIAESSGYYRIHRTMREALRARLRPDVGQVQNAWFRGHWEERGEDALAFYHHWFQDPEAALADWAAAHQDRVGAARMADARALLAVWAEIRLDGDDRHLLSETIWAATHLALGQAYWKTPSAPRQAVLARAIEHFQAALSVYTEDAAPERWADAQMGLALCLLYLPTGDRGEHLSQAMTCLQNALGTYTAAGNPEAWSAAQNHLGIVYARLPDGDESINQRRALACFEAAVQVWSETEHPKVWARGQHNLGVTYQELPDGDPAENQRRAIGYFEAALRVRTKEAFPSGWALTQFNLGETYLCLAALPEEDRPQRLSQATQCFKLALEVYTQADFPELWAETQNSLSLVWRQMPASGTAFLDNLHRAVSLNEAALEVWNEADYPGDWAKAQFELGTAWKMLASHTQDTAAKTAARAAFQAAHQGYTAVGLSEKADACLRALDEV